MGTLRWAAVGATVLVSLACGSGPSTTAQAAVAPASAGAPLAHGHAHNDYLNAHPLESALGHGFTSVEADTWLENGKLLLCHDYENGTCYDDTPDIGGGKRAITARELGPTYLAPLAARVASNAQHRVYDNWEKPFYLVIEIKCQSAASSAQSCGSDYPLSVAHAVIGELDQYRSMLTSYDPDRSQKVVQNAVTVVFTGANGPIKNETSHQPRSYFFDANLNSAASADVTITPMLIADYRASSCASTGKLSAAERSAVQTAHAKQIVVRIYNMPDCPWRTDDSGSNPPGWAVARVQAWEDVTSACVDYLSSDHLGLLDTWLTDHYPGPCDGGNGGGTGTALSSLSYTGTNSAEYHHSFVSTATLTADGGGPISGGTVQFSLGDATSGETCTATTDSSGTAACTLQANEQPGPVELAVSFAGNDSYADTSIVVPFTITRQATTLTYSGVAHIANGTPAHLSAALAADNATAVPGRAVTFTLGTGTTAQSCDATTDSAGTARCDISSVNQSLTSFATVPLAVTFAGDTYYLPSNTAASLRLQYMTGRSYGLSGRLPLLAVGPEPDTGQVRTASATTIEPPCTTSVSALVLSADALCARVVTAIAPGSVTAVATVADTTIGIVGLPVVELSGVTATSTSNCTGASGSVTLTVSVAGTRISVPTAPNSGLDLGAGLRLVVNEQTPVSGADHGLTVNAAHLTASGGMDVMVASSSSSAHNCT
jgi:hypothetical protein